MGQKKSKQNLALKSMGAQRLRVARKPRFAQENHPQVNGSHSVIKETSLFEELSSEVLELIFNFLEERDLLDCANVCLTWRKVILARFPTVNALPDTALKRIFGQLRDRELISASLVCRKWMDIVIELALPLKMTMTQTFEKSLRGQELLDLKHVNKSSGSLCHFTSQAEHDFSGTKSYPLPAFVNEEVADFMLRHDIAALCTCYKWTVLDLDEFFFGKMYLWLSKMSKFNVYIRLNFRACPREEYAMGSQHHRRIHQTEDWARKFNRIRNLECSKKVNLKTVDDTTLYVGYAPLSMELEAFKAQLEITKIRNKVISCFDSTGSSDNLDSFESVESYDSRRANTWQESPAESPL